MTQEIILPQKGTQETIPVTVDFSDRLVNGETINGASCTPTVVAGTDASPSSILSGSITFTTTTVTQNITAGVNGVIYALGFVVTTTGSHNYAKVGNLAVINAATSFQ